MRISDVSSYVCSSDLHADETPRLVDDGSRDQRRCLKPQRDLFLIHVDRNQCLFALHHIADRDVARGAEDPAQLARADRAVHRIDDEDFPEITGEFGVFAQPIDDVTDYHMFGHRDQVARSEEHTSELQSLMRISYAVFCLKKKNKT